MKINIAVLAFTTVFLTAAPAMAGNPADPAGPGSDKSVGVTPIMLKPAQRTTLLRSTRPSRQAPPIPIPLTQPRTLPADPKTRQGKVGLNPLGAPAIRRS